MARLAVRGSDEICAHRVRAGAEAERVERGAQRNAAARGLETAATVRRRGVR